jgi:hypothetical protein
MARGQARAGGVEQLAGQRRLEASPVARSMDPEWSEAKKPGSLVCKKPLLRVPFDRKTGLSLQALG